MNLTRPHRARACLLEILEGRLLLANRIHGVDVSQFQGAMNWDAEKSTDGGGWTHIASPTGLPGFRYGFVAGQLGTTPAVTMKAPR